MPFLTKQQAKQPINEQEEQPLIWQTDCSLPHPQLRQWLFDASSLTAKLKSLSSQFRVEVLFQQNIPCQHHELEFLNLQPTDTPIVREVLLWCDQVPWVYARSIIPLHALNKEHQALAQMGTNPLGEVLFTDPHIQPGRIQVADFSTHPQAVAYNQRYAAQTLDLTPPLLWGRRRLFHLPDGDISVAEVFLSQAPCYTNNTQLSDG